VKHVIVIETPDGKNIPDRLAAVLVRAVEIGVTEGHSICFVQARFNFDSAVAAVHEMYNAPKWEPNEQSN
jgi:hypothetical protein